MFARSLSVRRAGALLGELLLLVVGINVALWFEGKFEDRREAMQESEYLEGLADDLEIDLENLHATIQFNERKVEQVKNAITRLDDLLAEPPDVQQAIMFLPSNYQTFEPSDFTYQAMLQSGDFRLLTDPEVKADLMRLMRQYRQIATLQFNFLDAMDSGYIPVMMGAFDLAEGRLADPELIENRQFRNFFAYTVNDTNAMLAAYRQASSTAEALLARIRVRDQG